MAEKPASERSEKPTPDRLRKARREGKVPQSTEVCSALMVATLLIFLILGGPKLFGALAGEVRKAVSFSLPSEGGAAGLSELLRAKGERLLVIALPFLLSALAVSFLSSLLVSGWACAPKMASPDVNRISPSAGFKNLFSVRSPVRLLFSLAKLTLILAAVYAYLHGRLETCLALRWATPGQSLLAIAGLVVGLTVRIVVILLALGIADALFQRWKYRRDLRMTRQEVKEEVREHELSPHVRARIRSLQMSTARRRMLKEVPAADLVLVNPTHVAVALKYDADTMEAPKLVAKGADFMAEKIREVAADHDVPIVRRPELARTLYDTVELDQLIPESLFVAVAEVLAMIYRLRRKRLGLTERRPAE